ncbi:LSM domain protein [Macrococcus equi]|uniref:LSM domain protein n=1 Tax=Macrococcus equi TaxID=3395462 RepID=UPI0039BEC3C7
MQLWKFVGKNVEIVTVDDEKFIAYVNNYEDDTTNDNNLDSIDFTIDGDLTPYSLNENEIKSIKELE